MRWELAAHLWWRGIVYDFYERQEGQPATPVLHTEEHGALLRFLSLAKQRFFAFDLVPDVGGNIDPDFQAWPPCDGVKHVRKPS